MTRNRHDIGFRLLACALLWLGYAGTCSAAEPVGVVAEYRPAFARYVLQRGGAQVPARMGTTVMAGDRITLPADGVLVVQLADQTSRRFSGPGSYEVPAVASGNRLMAVLASLPALFEEQHKRYGTAATRGGAACSAPDAQPEPIVVQVLDGGARVIAGRRTIDLAWRGGCKPYDVTVRAEGGQVLMQREGVADRRVALGLALPPGRYAVIVADAGGRRFEGVVESAAQGPPMPEEIARATGAVGDVGRGAWWAGQADANWRLMACEALQPSVEAGDGLARALAESLLSGRAPPQ